LPSKALLLALFSGINEENARMETSSSSSSSLSSSSSASSSGGGHAGNGKEDADSFDNDAQDQKLFDKVQALEAAWVGAFTSNRQDDAKFIQQQLDELTAFMDTHRSVLGIDMMPESMATLKEAVEPSTFFGAIIPMVVAKAEREKSQTDLVYTDLIHWIKTSRESTGSSVDDLIEHICNEERKLQEAFEAAPSAAAAKSKRGKKDKDTKNSIWEDRATLFKPLNLADSEVRSERNKEKSRKNRASALEKARAKPAGWKEAGVSNDESTG
jgi:hypothetical protein